MGTVKKIQPMQLLDWLIHGLIIFRQIKASVGGTG